MGAAEDQEQLERIRSKLYDFVSNSPDHENAPEARRILGKIPGRQAQDASDFHGPKNLTDEQAGTENPALQFVRTEGKSGSGYARPARSSDEQREYEGNQEPLKNDILAREMTQQAMFMGALHLLGGGVSRLGQAFIEGTPGGRALETVRAAEAEAPGGYEMSPSARAEMNRLEDAGHIDSAERAADEAMHPTESQEVRDAREVIRPKIHGTDLFHPKLAIARNLAGPGTALAGAAIRGTGDLMAHPSVAFPTAALLASPLMRAIDKGE
jgi:hypothetical protein